jgi:hypothetical protein
VHGFFQEADRFHEIDLVARLSIIAARYSHADLPAVDELRQGRECIRGIDRVPEVGHEDRGSELDRHPRRYRSQDDKDVPVAQVIVDPHLIEVVRVRQLREFDPLGHGVMVGDMCCEL